MVMDQTNTTKAKADERVNREKKRMYTLGTLGDIWTKDSSNFLVSVKVTRENEKQRSRGRTRITHYLKGGKKFRRG